MTHRFDIDFALVQGAFELRFSMRSDARTLALYGPSGSGKTSVLEVIAGLRRPQQGRVSIDNRVYFDSALGLQVPVHRRRVGYVPQDALLFPHLDVHDNIFYGATREESPRVEPLLRQLELQPLIRRSIAALSGGERQRVALVRALATEPQVLLLDEPVSALDDRMKRRVLDLLTEVRDSWGVVSVYVTHAADEAMSIADEAVRIEDGRVVAQGPATAVLASREVIDAPR